MSISLLVFDNTFLYTFDNTPKQLTFTKSLRFKEAVTEYTITLIHKNTLLPSDVEYNLQWLNVFIRACLLDKGYIEVRRNMVNPERKIPYPPSPQQPQVTLWEGVKFVVYPSISGINLAADKAFCIIRADTLLDQYNKSNKEQFARDVENSFIVTTHGSRTSSYRVIRVCFDKSPETTKFKRKVKKEKGEQKEEKEDGEVPPPEYVEESVSDYYSTRYNIQLQPHCPLLVCRPTGRGYSRCDYIPLDVARATGLFVYFLLHSLNCIIPLLINLLVQLN